MHAVLAAYASSQDPGDPLAGLVVGERPEPEAPEGWEVVDIIEDGSAPGGPSDTVKVSKDGATEEITSDHLAFHHYVEYLREQEQA